MAKNKTNNRTSNSQASSLAARKNYYSNLITQHKSVLAKARHLIGVLLDRLEKEINDHEVLEIKALDIEQKATTLDKKALNSSPDRRNAFLWGDKESASAILTRLTTILLKLIPLEQEIARLDLTKADISELDEVMQKTRIPQEDMDIIERYVEKYNENKE